jgi:hypothetical protein
LCFKGFELYLSYDWHLSLFDMFIDFWYWFTWNLSYNMMWCLFNWLCLVEKGFCYCC